MVRETSKATFEKIKDQGLIKGLQLRIYEHVYTNQGCTKREVCEALNIETHNSARFTELRDMGVLFEDMPRECRITGQTVLTYVTTDNLPSKPEKKKTKAEKVKEARELIVRVGREIDNENLKELLREAWQLLEL